PRGAADSSRRPPCLRGRPAPVGQPSLLADLGAKYAREGMSWVQRLDRYQRRHRWLGLPLAVIYKFFDDRGPYLAALVTYYAFVSLFPLLLLLFSALGFFLQGHPDVRQEI